MAAAARIDKRQLFTQAWQVARATVAAFANLRAAFVAALKRTWQALKGQAMQTIYKGSYFTWWTDDKSLNERLERVRKLSNGNGQKRANIRNALFPLEQQIDTLGLTEGQQGTIALDLTPLEAAETLIAQYIGAHQAAGPQHRCAAPGCPQMIPVTHRHCARCEHDA